MTSLEDDAPSPLQPVWQAVVDGRIDRHDEPAIAAAFRELPRIPDAQQILEINNSLRTNLTNWEQGRGDPAQLGVLVAIALVTVEAARQSGNAALRLLTLEVARRSLDHLYGLQGEIVDLDRQIRLAEDYLRLIGQGPDRPRCLANLGTVLHDRYAARGDPADLDRSLVMLEEALVLMPDEPSRAMLMNNLGNALCSRFGCDADLANLQRGIGLYEEAVQLAPKGPDRPLYLANLGRALTLRYSLHRRPADLDRLVELQEEAVSLTLQDPKRPMFLDNLANALGKRYDLRQHPADLNRSIALHEEAVRLTPTGPNRPACLSNLAVAIGKRHALNTGGPDLDRSIGLHEEAVRLTPIGRDQATHLSNLGTALRERHRLLGNPADVSRQIDCFEEALRLCRGRPNYPTELNNLAAALGARYDISSEPTDLERNISLLEQAVAIAAEARERSMYLNNLGVALRKRYRLHGEQADLDRSLVLSEEAVRLMLEQDPGYLNNLATGLHDRYILLGEDADLDRAISVQEEIVQLVPDDPNRAMFLSNLAIDLDARYESRGDPADLDERIRLDEDALSLTLTGPDRARFLDRLSAALCDRYRLHGIHADATRAINLAGEAVRLTPDGSGRALYLNTLGNALAQIDHSDRLISVREEALRLTPTGPSRANNLNNLALDLLTRYGSRSDEADLDRSIALLEDSVRLTPTGPYRARRLANLAGGLTKRYLLRENSTDLGNSIGLYDEAVRLAGILRLPMIARRLALFRLMLGDSHPADGRAHLSGAAAALKTGAAALERMLVVAGERDEAALLGQYGDLYDLLVGAHLRLAGQAAAAGDAAAAAGHSEAAYLAAERGKGRRAAALLAARAARPRAEAVAPLLPEIERLRRALARLYDRLAGGPDQGERHPAAAGRGGWLAEAPAGGAASDSGLEPPRDFPAEPDHGDGRPAAERSDATRDELARQADEAWAALRARLDAVARADPDYAAVRGFAAPKPPQEVAAALPPGGSLVLLYPLDRDLACFVLRRPDDDAGIPLLAAAVAPLRVPNPAARGDTGRPAVLAGKAALAHLVARALPGGAPERESGALDGVLRTLGRALHPALSPLLPPPDPDDPASLVLVPTGALHRLPLHALPWPTVTKGRLLDGYAVSYAASADLVALAGRRPAAGGGAAALAPGLPEAAPLPGALAEAAALAALAGCAPRLRRRATVRALLDERVAAGVRWVLLATHGLAAGPDHGQSGLLLYDERGREEVWLTAAEILARLPLEGAEHLALGACSAHALDPAPGDRLAGLVRALLYRGARSVGATLWPVRDDAAALVNTWTFEALLGGEPDKAKALRAAVRRLRRCGGPEAAAELRRLAAQLPPDDPAREAVDEMAADLGERSLPFARTVDWAPFVLHGAPLIALAGAAAS